MRFNWSARVMSALRNGSLACNEGDVAESGCVKIRITSLAA